MTDKPTEAQQIGARMAEVVVWLIFAFIAIIALAVAIRIGLWIVGAPL